MPFVLPENIFYSFILINALLIVVLRFNRSFVVNSILKLYSMEKLTKQEENVMLYIWKLENCCIKDILAEMSEPKPPYTTVASVVKNLERKQYVKPSHVGNAYYYKPLIPESEYKRTFMSGFVRNYFANSYKEMVSFFAKDQKISAGELKDIIEMIEKGKEK